MRRGSACPVVTQEDDLIQPHTGDDEGPVAVAPLTRARFQVARLNDSLKEQLYRLLAVGVEVALPRAAPLRQLPRRQHPAPGRAIGGGESLRAVSRIAQERARHRQPALCEGA